MAEHHPPTLSRRTRDSGLVIVSIIGELDTAGTTELEPAFVAALPDRTVRAVIDMSGVPFLTSRALAMLVVRAQAMHKAGGKLCLAALGKVVSDVFDRAGFSSLFVIYPTVDEAIKALEQKKPRTKRPRDSKRMDYS
jgi:anti-sigma B factor antagonist